MLLQGDYSIQISAAGYRNRSISVTVPAQGKILNVTLPMNTGMFLAHKSRIDVNGVLNASCLHIYLLEL